MSRQGSKDYIRKIIVVIVAVIVIFIPLWILVINSFKGLAEAKTATMALPTDWQIKENYYKVFSEGRTITGFLNSLLFVTTVIPSVIFIASLAGWIFARAKSKLIKTVYYFAISGILIPPAVVTSIRIMKYLNIYGTRVGLIIFYIGIFMSLTIFFITGFIKSIPVELEESARIDGCNNFTVFFRIIIPLLRPVVTTLTIFLGLLIWNDFIWPIYMLRATKQFSLVMGLYYFISSTEHSINWHLVFTDVILVSLPFFILYIFAQKYIISGIMSGAMKQ